MSSMASNIRYVAMVSLPCTNELFGRTIGPVMRYGPDRLLFNSVAAVEGKYLSTILLCIHYTTLSSKCIIYKVRHLPKPQAVKVPRIFGIKIKQFLQRVQRP